MLVSALAMPAIGAGDVRFHRDLFEMAAAYLFHIVQNHPFVDSNKRVGAAVAAVFLPLNGFELNTAEDEFEKMVLAVAQGRLDKPPSSGPTVPPQAGRDHLGHLGWNSSRLDPGAPTTPRSTGGGCAGILIR